MEPTEDSFRALARSSPWRWTSLHLTHRDEGGETEAWVERPERLLVRTTDGEFRADGWPYSSSGPGPAVHPHDRPPVLRPDGLVAERPADPAIRYGDPMWQSYRWVAMLDPVELSHDVEVSDPRADALHDRPVWRARLRPVTGYDPTCSCCPLLRSVIADAYEHEEGWLPDPTTPYPDAFDVALDLQTAVVVSVAPVPAGSRGGFGNVIHEVG